jgi:predicted AAA+ superfamily ATPase
MVRQLQPWVENLKKRQVKAPKIYIRDSGILHSLLALPEKSIYTNVKVGASWEGFVIEQILQEMNTRDCYYWRTHAGAELDLLVLKDGKRIGFEVKYSEIPKITKSMHNVIEDLKLDMLYIVNPGARKLQMEKKIIVLPAVQITSTKF